MALPLLKTLGEIRADIQIRLGFGMAGQAGVVNAPLIDSFIRSAQEQLIEQYDFLRLKGFDERTTGASQQFYDYPEGCDAYNLKSVSIYWNGRVIPLKEGIEPTDRGITPSGPPQKYERRDQIELWPIPSSNEYTIRTEFMKEPGALVNNSDRVSIDSQLIFLHALSNAKAHYRQPDAQTYASQLDAYLLKMKQKHRGTTVYGKSTPVGMYDYVDSSQQV